MVKADPTNDYYGALELSPTCSVDDVKRQYRKLALLHHPDRNPGKEQEAAARFQLISAAHEILVDKEQRQKYDLIRMKGNAHHAPVPKPAPPPARNPHAKDGMWGPPPVHGDAHPAPYRRQEAPTTSTGAQRYTKSEFSNGPPQASNTSSKQQADRKADHANAWNHVHNPKKAPGGPPPLPNRPSHNVPPPYAGRQPHANAEQQSRPFGRRSPLDGQRTSRQWNDGTPHKSAYEETRRTSRPSLHHAQTATNAARHDAYDFVSRSTAAPQPPYNRTNPPKMGQAFAPAPPPRAPTAKRPQPARHSTSHSREDIPFMDHPRDHPQHRKRPHDQVPFSELNRERTPYIGHTNEKTYFGRDPMKEALKRSASVKDTTKLNTQATSNGTSERPRSASITRSTPSKPYMVYSSNESSASATSSQSDLSPRAQPTHSATPTRPDTALSPQQETTSAASDPHLVPDDGPADELESQQHPNEHVRNADAMDIDPPEPHQHSGDASATSAGQSMNMHELRQSSPLSADPSGGISNMDSLSNNLPFTSKASETHPSRSPTVSDPPPTPTSANVSVQRPPKPPLPPSTLTHASWSYYLAQMNGYLKAWDSFNGRILSHFQDRAVQNQEREMVDGWLGAVGETGTLGGWESYAKAVKEDERLRMHWNTACEKHAAAVGVHENLRTRVREVGLVG